ncbi:TetR/AcrR family transcriptional regulator [Schaalia vaccimaxillae]|uniref:TetR/AcrR family transcriptional regulator n=1 Tax=Schaalia vaccimaxillae TaxID=183916 RepID=UPI00041E5651|nr:TetR/AcrR family transcriptional regulator [Schaalia vaccimaxillae]
MPRISKKDQAVRAALKIIEDEGVRALTYDSLSTTTGISKSGLIYHFPSRHELLVECHRYCAARWNAELEALAGGRKASELSVAERQRVMVLSLGKNDPVIELLMSIHSQEHPDFLVPWKSVDDEWMLSGDDGSSDERELSDLMIVLMGMGLWVFDHVASEKLPDEKRQMIVERLLARIDSGEPLEL